VFCCCFWFCFMFAPGMFLMLFGVILWVVKVLFLRAV
jgi:hypothetical protein